MQGGPAAGQELQAVPGGTGRRLAPAVAEMLGRMDPETDGWETEAWSSAAGAQLTRLLELWSDSYMAPDVLDDVLDPAFVCGPLRPAELRIVFQNDAFRVLRPDPDASAGSTGKRTYVGPAGLVRALRALGVPFAGDLDFHTKLKVIEISVEDETFSVTALYLAFAHPKTGVVQQNATWRCVFRLPAEDASPRLVSIVVEKFEEVVRPQAGPLFADCTAAVLGANESYGRQLLPGLDHWRGRIASMFGTTMLGHQGIAVGDANGDGLDDVYVCQPGGLPNLLYLRAEDGTYTDASARAGVDFMEVTSSALWLDLDGDGDQDLVVSAGGEMLFLENDGAARFQLRTRVEVTNTTSLAAADYDGDGDLDLFVCGYVSPYDGRATPIPYHDANNGQPNVLLESDGEFGFTDATVAAGLDVNNRRFSFAASFEDFDNDGDQDLYVANDFGRNNLYRNDGGRFTDVAAAAGVEDVSAGMGVAWGDVDGDGWMDLYVSNMYSSAGNRITYQRRFKAGTDESVREQFQRHARGNSLFLNNGDGTFEDVTLSAGVNMGRWAWGAVFIDLDNDGRQDIVVPNGFVTGQRTQDL